MLKSRILSILTPGLRATTSEIARSLSADVDTVGRRLRELCAAGKVARLAMGGGKVAWQLAVVSATSGAAVCRDVEGPYHDREDV